MNEEALIKIQSIVIGLDRDLHKYVKELIDGQSRYSEEQLTITINSTEKELTIYNYILKLIINDGNKN
jgi:hypothetical protein